MTDLVITNNRVPAMADKSVAMVQALQEELMNMPAVSIPTDHVLHGGMYARTIIVPPGIVMAGALIKVPTLLIVNGHARVFIGEKSVDIIGYHVLAASALRKQALITIEETSFTLIFTTQAKTVEEAEDEFTDEAHLLFSRKECASNTVTITGE